MEDFCPSPLLQDILAIKLENKIFGFISVKVSTVGRNDFRAAKKAVMTKIYTITHLHESGL